MTSQHRSERRIQEFRTFVTLYHVALSFGDYLFECICNVSSRFRSNRHRPGSFAENVYTGEQVTHAVVGRGERRHVDEIHLIQVRDAFRISLASREANSPGLVQRVGISAGQVALRLAFRTTGVSPQSPNAGKTTGCAGICVDGIQTTFAVHTEPTLAWWVLPPVSYLCASCGQAVSTTPSIRPGESMTTTPVVSAWSVAVRSTSLFSRAFARSVLGCRRSDIDGARRRILSPCDRRPRNYCGGCPKVEDCDRFLRRRRRVSAVVCTLCRIRRPVRASWLPASVLHEQTAEDRQHRR